MTEPTRPLWRDEVPISGAEEQYVSRRQLGKFLVLTSLGMFAGNVWIAIRSAFRREASWPERVIAQVGEVRVGGVKVFRYPGPDDGCLLLHPDEDTWVAYSQKCTHLSCAVVWSPESGRILCPCHNGVFAARDGSVIQGPPRRPLPRVRLERRGLDLVAVGMDGEG